MKTFKEYLLENAKGNYVCIDVEDDLSTFFADAGMQDPVTGDKPPKGDYHCTLMYSKETSKDPENVMRSIKKYFEESYTAQVEGFDCFDSTPKEGDRDVAKSCIVMKLKCEALHDIHKHLQSVGLDHSYPEYSPHVTLQYNMSVEEAHYYKDKLNATKDKQLTLSKYKSATINKDYV